MKKNVMHEKWRRNLSTSQSLKTFEIINKYLLVHAFAIVDKNSSLIQINDPWIYANSKVHEKMLRPSPEKKVYSEYAFVQSTEFN